MDSLILALLGETATKTGSLSDSCFIIISNVYNVAVAVSAIILT